MKTTKFLLLVCVWAVQVSRIRTAGSQVEEVPGWTESRCERAGGSCLLVQRAWCNAHLAHSDCPPSTSCCLEVSSAEINKTRESSLGRKVLQLSPKTIENQGIRVSGKGEAPRAKKSSNNKRRKQQDRGGRAKKSRNNKRIKQQDREGNEKDLRRSNKRRRINEKTLKRKASGKNGKTRSGYRKEKQINRIGKKNRKHLGPAEQRPHLTVKKNTENYTTMQAKKHRVGVDYNDDDKNDDDDDNDDGDDVQLPTNTKKHQDTQHVKPFRKHTLRKKQGNKKGCRQARKCRKSGGTCQKSCSKKENELPKGCKKGCRCCSSSSSSGKCKSRSKCKALKGTCKTRCENTEVLIPNGCAGGSCHCCVQEIVDCPSSSECPGRCLASCPGVLSTASCLGTSCSCCLSCRSTPACSEKRGTCRAECSCGEQELPGGCSGNGCKCCIPDVPGCSGSSQCSGQCVYGPLCTGAILSSVTCSGQAGCACCKRG